MIRSILIKLALLASSIFVAGCNNSVSTSEPDPAASAETGPTLNLCADPRPEMCTQEYNPVCATLKDGTKKTYANGCTSCADANVTGWLPGECQ